MSNNKNVIACDPHALSSAEQEYWVKEIVPKLYSQVQEIQELPNGWLWRLPNTAEVLTLVAQDLNMERLCCPFVRYTLEIEPHHGHFWLRMTGEEGVKEFLRMSFEAANYFNPQVAHAAGLVVDNVEMKSVATALEATENLNARYARTVGETDEAQYA